MISSKKELTLPLSLSIKDLKQDILENHWSGILLGNLCDEGGPIIGEIWFVCFCF